MESERDIVTPLEFSMLIAIHRKKIACFLSRKHQLHLSATQWVSGFQLVDSEF
jgi:hypothetical protein